jgi:hypothetical protein
MTRTRLVLACGLLAIMVFSLAILLQRAPRRSGTNLTGDAGFVIPLVPGQQLCEASELVPGDTSGLELNADAKGAPGPALHASILTPHGTLAAGWQTGHIRIPLTRVRDTTGATVCIRNQGSTAVAFGGSIPDSGFQVEDAGQVINGRLRIDYLRPGRESWLQLLPTLVYRFSLGKSDLVRHWSAGAVLLLMMLAISLAFRTVLREEQA